MPAHSHALNPLFTTTISSPSSPLAQSPDSKARTEYERDRQKSLKSHDLLKKHRNHNHHHRAAAHAAALTAKRHHASGHWRNLIDMEDIRTPPLVLDRDHRQEDAGKENSPVAVSLEELIAAAAAPAPAISPKPRQGFTRSPHPRHTSSDDIATLFPALALVSLTSPPPPPHATSASPSPSLLPMLSSSPFLSTQPLSSDDDSLFDEFSSPGADDWMMDETEDGCLRYVCTTTTSFTVASSASDSSIIVVEKCVW